MASIDYYRVLNVARTASSKEIKAAYFQLAKSLHPDVTGNDVSKAERFRYVSEAHSVLSNPQKRREYDTSRPANSFRSCDTSGMTQHPYATMGDGSDLRARPLYGIDEEVWLAHHYGQGAARRDDMPPRYYGMEVAEKKLEQQRERIRRHQRHYKLNRTSGYFLRREARLKKHEEDKAESEAKHGKESNPNSACVIT
ncbi:chaperone protein [Plasmopara halstedii]|uniref:Chaperone protein n=1 Tax=Plasmopara halstedii TaxID=4781 RepID=A0A0P1A9R7_PLAHL|nr:chaperone protein [Plasmopara halstedii]CEG37280.1 chaperone protein [Plasmopara halstedii]|eukprot:XP_024573649.1 chaperone protein [Plasmopara halstedii]